ncbi:MAG: hypothetical protein WBN65_06240, partial [Gammaproteobacteria bacterium]
MIRLRIGAAFGVLMLALCAAWPAAAADASGAKRTAAASFAGGPRYEQMARKSATLIAQSDMGGLAEHLRQLQSDASLNDAARERLLRETVLDLATLMPQSEIRTEIRSLSGYQAKTWIVEDEHGHAERFPAYDVAAAARFVEQRWRETAAHKTAAEAIARSDITVVDRYIGGSAAERQGFEEAFAAATAERTTIYADDLQRRLAAGEPVAGLARVVARVSGDRALLETVILEAPPGEALRALAAIDPADGSPVSLAIL